MKLCVIGTGYVGLVSAACFAEIGHEVIGVDIDEAKIAKLKKGECPIYEPGLPELLKKHLEGGRITFTTNLDEGIHACPLIMAAVGTPVGQGRRADRAVWDDREAGPATPVEVDLLPPEAAHGRRDSEPGG